MRYAGAGHPPLLVWRLSTRNVDELEENGLVLGLFADATDLEIEVPMEPGDTVVLYADGVLEAGDISQEMYGPDGFKRFLEINSSRGADEFSDALLDELSLWSSQPRGQGQQDDITLLAVDFKTL